MFQHQGIWLPDGEKHFPQWMDSNRELVDGKGTYQIRKIRAALEHCKQFRVAVDVGAHVGLWSMHLVKRFARVEAFEPMDMFRECFVRNVFLGAAVEPEAFLHDCALGAGGGTVSIAYDPADSGGTHVSERGSIVADVNPLDDFNFFDVDLIKIDCEGYEHHVIAGAVDTIRRCKPVIIVEQKQHKLGQNFGIKGTPAVDLLKLWGYQVRAEISGDYILTP